MPAAEPTPVRSTPTANLVVREHNGRVFWEAKFRHDGRQVMRRVGPAWLQLADSGEWRPRRGRMPADAYDERRAHVRAAELVKQYVAEAGDRERTERERRARGITFRELAALYMLWLERERSAKPATLRDHHNLLAEPGTPHKRGSGRAFGHIMAALGDKPAVKVTTADVKQVLRTVAETGVTPRTVNKHRNLVGAIFAYGVREHGLALNPVVGIARRPEPDRAVLVYYRPEEVEALARALADGQHRSRSDVAEGHRPSRADHRARPEPRRQSTAAERSDAEVAGDGRSPAEGTEDRQDAEVVRVAAYAGLRLGELLALRWRDVDWTGSALTVSRAMSVGVEGPTKSGRIRRVPLSDQAAGALERLSHRDNFTGPDEFVFVNALGRPLDGSALRRRFKAARDAAGLRALRWHDLRHTFGSLLVASGVDLVSVQDALGHSQIGTTQRYLHARPHTERAAAFTAAFAATGTDALAAPSEAVSEA